MSRRRWVVVWMIASGLWAGLAAGCATGPTTGASGESDVTRAPAEPLFRRSFGTPGAREWDFVIGNDYSER
jgi:hypothetical protein